MSTMLVAFLPLLVTLLVGPPSTLTAVAMDHLNLDTSGTSGTMRANHGEFAGQHLSKKPIPFFEKTAKLDELKLWHLLNEENIFSQWPSGLNGKYELKSSHINSDTQAEVRGPSIVLNEFENRINGSYPCPEPIDIAPCVCTSTINEDLALDCSLVESAEQLAEVFMQDFPVKEYFQLEIVRNDKIEVLSDIFNGVSFRNIYFFNVTNLREITSDAFADSINYLEEIYIFSSALDENTFPFNSLEEFSYLVFLTIGDSQIKVLPAFNSSSIESINFSDGNVAELPAGKYMASDMAIS